MIKTITVTVLLALILTAICGCGRIPAGGLDTADGKASGTVQEPSTDKKTCVTETETASDTKEQNDLYLPILDAFSNLIYADTGDADVPVPDGGMGIREGLYGDPDLPKHVGYTVRDLSGDGNPELLIGTISDTDAAPTMIYAIFTITDGRVSLVLEGAYRNAYYLLEDGSLFHQGSGGAAYAIFGQFDLSRDGTTLNCRDYWFTHEKDGNFEDIRFWHNTVGEMDVTVSEELDITYDTFNAMQSSFAEQRTVFPLTAFSEYENAPDIDDADKAMLLAVYLEEYTGTYDSFIADSEPYATEVVFFTDRTVTDLKVLSLVEEVISDDGDIHFSSSELYHYGTLTPESGLSVKMSLPEIIPFYGISYTDTDGITRILSVNMSGRDGSVYLALEEHFTPP